MLWFGILFAKLERLLFDIQDYTDVIFIFFFIGYKQIVLDLAQNTAGPGIYCISLLFPYSGTISGVALCLLWFVLLSTLSVFGVLSFQF